MRERFGATHPRALQLRFHTQTAGSTLTAQQPDNNIVRVAIQALAAVLGGTQSLHTNGRDEALALPTEESARIALRTQQIIAHESGVADTIDPVRRRRTRSNAGRTTIEAGARELLDRIDAIGGTLAAIEAGYIQRQIQDSAYKAQVAIDTGASVVVGVNSYQTDEASRVDVFELDPEIERAAGRAGAGSATGPRSVGVAARPSTRWAARREDGTTCSRPSSRRSRRGPRSARSRMHCARCSASTGKRASMSDLLLSVEGLTTTFDTSAGPLTAVSGVTFSLARGETLGLVGESGSGKSVTAFSLIRLVQAPGRITDGRVVFQGRDLLTLPEEEMRQVRGAGIGFIFQEPMAALNPVMRVGAHIAEALRVHGLASPGGSPIPSHRPAARGEDRGCRTARRRLSPPAVRGHAPARDDRHRARLPPAAGHRRRADHGAGRHGAGADPRPAA